MQKLYNFEYIFQFFASNSKTGLWTKDNFFWLIPFDNTHCGASESKANIGIYIKNEMPPKLIGQEYSFSYAL